MSSPPAAYVRPSLTQPRAGVIFTSICTLVVVVALVSGTAAAATCWRPPVEGQVADPFRPPSCRWCPGNRGIEYDVGSRADVRAAAPGVVTFSGAVAGVVYVVVRLDNGWRHTYGRLVSPAVDVGDRVRTSERVGTASGEFFFGLRIDDDYADPAPWIGALVGRPRLVPIDGSPPRPNPPVLRCPSV